ncbi:uncharacterized protein KGF55_002955 [Candida pseudojiufengensis]|uniref:uncharacterized protein n=1 Tax=Candida pseudojiufengensis TaxID=497109 RepID=UPI0022257D23|nr:uncharacterized protein KGF55_002955 [Candida pseudojiufengensis]KAI5963163.1 hypothetical protein KGF55_002955 [Candida pseudojiufengensis]
MLRSFTNHNTRILRLSYAFQRLNSVSSKSRAEESSSTTHESILSNSSSSDANSAIVDKMKQILEEKITSSSSNISSLKNLDPSINSILTEHDYGKKENRDHIQAQSYIKSEPLLNRNKHAKDIYNSKPWDGTESTYDSNLRMIIDSVPKPINDPMSTFKTKRRKSSNERLSIAKDVSLDYKINKSPEDKEKEKFREMYKEKLLGPSMFLNKSSLSSIDYVGALAGNKINASIDQQTGRFEDSPEMVNVRGKPLSKEHLKNCTDTNYFMNQVLNKQEILPPWIENQQTLNKSINEFKKSLDEMWFKWIINESIMQNIIERASSVDEILDYYENNISKITMEDNSLNETNMNYITAKVKLLNSEIRHYNLQCPSLSSHKYKLREDIEVENSYWRTLENFSSHIEAWFDRNRKRKNSKLIDRTNLSSAGKVFQNFSLKGSPDLHVNTEIDTKLHLWQAIKDIFKKDTKTVYR